MPDCSTEDLCSLHAQQMEERQRQIDKETLYWRANNKRQAFMLAWTDGSSTAACMQGLGVSLLGQATEAVVQYDPVVLSNPTNADKHILL